MHNVYNSSLSQI